MEMDTPRERASHHPEIGENRKQETGNWQLAMIGGDHFTVHDTVQTVEPPFAMAIPWHASFADWLAVY